MATHIINLGCSQRCQTSSELQNLKDAKMVTCRKKGDNKQKNPEKLGCFVESGRGDVHHIPNLLPLPESVTNIPLRKALKMIFFFFPVWWNMRGWGAVSFFMNFQIEIKANFNFSTVLRHFKKHETWGDLLRMSTSSNSPSPLRRYALLATNISPPKKTLLSWWLSFSLSVGVMDKRSLEGYQSLSETLETLGKPTSTWSSDKF